MAQAEIVNSPQNTAQRNNDDDDVFLARRHTVNQIRQCPLGADLISGFKFYPMDDNKEKIMEHQLSALQLNFQLIKLI